MSFIFELFTRAMITVKSSASSELRRGKTTLKMLKCSCNTSKWLRSDLKKISVYFLKTVLGLRNVQHTPGCTGISEMGLSLVYGYKILK